MRNLSSAAWNTFTAGGSCLDGEYINKEVDTAHISKVKLVIFPFFVQYNFIPFINDMTNNIFSNINFLWNLIITARPLASDQPEIPRIT